MTTRNGSRRAGASWNRLTQRSEERRTIRDITRLLDSFLDGDPVAGEQLLLRNLKTQPTKVKVVGTFHVPFTWNRSKSLDGDGTAERAC
jgi:hypothetical protein